MLRKFSIAETVLLATASGTFLLIVVSVGTAFLGN